MSLFNMPLVEVSHIGIHCTGRSKNAKVVGIFRAVEVANFSILCPHCHNVVTVSGEALKNPERYPEYGCLRYKDVSQRYQGK